MEIAYASFRSGQPNLNRFLRANNSVRIYVDSNL
jgi:hypothetical protein